MQSYSFHENTKLQNIVIKVWMI